MEIHKKSDQTSLVPMFNVTIIDCPTENDDKDRQSELGPSHKRRELIQMVSVQRATYTQTMTKQVLHDAMKLL